MASPTSRCAILLSLLFADTAALRLGAAASRPRRVRLYLSLPRELLALNVIPAAVAEAESTAENWAALRECDWRPGGEERRDVLYVNTGGHNALHSQMLYDPATDPLWGEIKVCSASACARLTP